MTENNVKFVVPLVGTWIETRLVGRHVNPVHVVPLVGTWIETVLTVYGERYKVSFPSWERGLKHIGLALVVMRELSFPSWERGLKQITVVGICPPISGVVPLVGTWIETSSVRYSFLLTQMSFPSWERGLKLPSERLIPNSFTVVPLVGTWIETAVVKLRYST